MYITLMPSHEPYFERQKGRNCYIHAFNNALGKKAVSFGSVKKYGEKVWKEHCDRVYKKRRLKKDDDYYLMKGMTKGDKTGMFSPGTVEASSGIYVKQFDFTKPEDITDLVISNPGRYTFTGRTVRATLHGTAVRYDSDGYAWFLDSVGEPQLLDATSLRRVYGDNDIRAARLHPELTMKEVLEAQQPVSIDMTYSEVESEEGGPPITIVISSEDESEEGESPIEVHGDESEDTEEVED